MALSTNDPIGPAQVAEICKLRDDAYRNLWITFAYWDISQRLREVIGDDNASWCTFSTWSSRTIGDTLRLDKASRRIDELMEDETYSITKQESRLKLELQYRISTRDDGKAQRVLGLGNRLVFEEIGSAAIRFLEWFADHKDTRDDAAWKAHRETIESYKDTELFPAADVEQLRGGLESYYLARFEDDPDKKAELVLRGNVLLGAYEQWRVDRILKVALDPFPARFLRVLRADPGVLPELTLAGDGAPWALRHQSPIRRALAAQFGAGMTRWVMALDAPLFGTKITPLRVGRSVPAPPPGSPTLQDPLDSKLERLFGIYDRSKRTPLGSAARNWTRFGDRMNFIANLFRTGQKDTSLYRKLPDADLRTLDLDLSDEKLDCLRRVGDPEIDDSIRERCDADHNDPREFLRKLVAGEMTKEELDPGPPRLPEWKDDELLAAGQKFFRDYRLEIGSALFCAGLPMSYTATLGVPVLTTTAAFVSDAERRVAETGMMLLAAMADNDSSQPPLRPNTAAFKAARNVRLFHGAVRHMILTDNDLHWQTETAGVPINQEDLLGTLAVFTVVVIEALDKMGVRCTVENRDAYFHLWLVIGHIMGIEYEGLYRPSRRSRKLKTDQPLAYAEMQLLARVIFDRHSGPSPDGQVLMSALLDASERSTPFLPKGVARALVRRLIGDESADMLGIPPPGAMRLVVSALRPINALISPRVHSNTLGRLANSLTSELYRNWIKAREGSRPPWLDDPAPVRALRKVDQVVGDSPYTPPPTKTLTSAMLNWSEQRADSSAPGTWRRGSTPSSAPAPTSAPADPPQPDDQ
jgi:ER-bound oxygenase mpaB/B'/Rubber oxygenase, catalytic domain